MFVIPLQDLFASHFIELDFEEFLGRFQLERLPLSQPRHVQRSSGDKIYYCMMATVAFLFHYLSVTVE